MGGMKSGRKSKPLALTKSHHQIDSSLLDIQVCAEENGCNSTLKYGVDNPKWQLHPIRV